MVGWFPKTGDENIIGSSTSVEGPLLLHFICIQQLSFPVQVYAYIFTPFELR